MAKNFDRRLRDLEDTLADAAGALPALPADDDNAADQVALVKELLATEEGRERLREHWSEPPLPPEGGKPTARRLDLSRFTTEELKQLLAINALNHRDDR